MNRKLLEELYEQRSELNDRKTELDGDRAHQQCEHCQRGSYDDVKLELKYLTDRLDATNKLIDLIWSEAYDAT